MSTILGIDFAALSLKDALDLAILIEEEARERYEDFTDQMVLHHTPDAARFFRFMAGNEEKHRAELTARRKELFGSEPSRVTRGMLFVVAHRVRAPKAVRAEKKAWQFFAEATPRVADLRVQALFAELRDEEVHHQKLVLAELEKTPPESALRHRDIADDPVAQ